MLEGLDALLALQRFGTVSEAATRLRLTQSAVSKRIQALQDELGYRIVEPDGRRLRLTDQAIDLLERARPLVADLRGLKAPGRSGAISRFSLALADSIAASWGPGVVRRALAGASGIAVDLHSHRSVLVIESVRLGRYHVGLCTDPLGAPDLIHHPLVEEPMVLVNSGCGGKTDGKSPLITIEASSAAWDAVEPLLRTHQPRLLQRELVPVESFSAALQMVRAGFGDGLLPLGLVLEMRLDRGSYRALSGIRRPVSLLTRKTINALAGFRLLREQLTKAAAAYFSQTRGR
jgi:DNA-binding transcriptional LysR family regulator